MKIPVRNIGLAVLAMGATVTVITILPSSALTQRFAGRSRVKVPVRPKPTGPIPGQDSETSSQPPADDGGKDTEEDMDQDIIDGESRLPMLLSRAQLQLVEEGLNNEALSGQAKCWQQ